MEIKTVSLKDFSSLRVGGEGQIVEVSTLEELTEALVHAKQRDMRVHILGEGTNTFFGDTLQNILIIKNEIKGIVLSQLQPTTYNLQAGSGEIWDDLVRFAVEKGLWGIENLSLVPGTVGAAPVQNIGAYGVELANVFVSLSALDTKTLNVVEIDGPACSFGYRDSLFKQVGNPFIIVSVTLRLSKEPRPILTYKPLDALVGKENLTIGEVRDVVIATRKSKLPDYKEYPNTGSFFKNPVVSGAEGEALRIKYPDIPLIDADGGFKIPAAWLIEHVAHMKGVRRGEVGTWPTQPLVIVNYGDADAEEIIAFSDEITKRIKDKTGVTLEREVNYVS